MAHDQAEKALEKPAVEPESSYDHTEDVQAAQQETAASYKADMEQRKRDYDNGVERTSSSYVLLKEMPIAIYDGGIKKVSHSANVEQKGLARGLSDAANGRVTNQNPDGSVIVADTQGRITSTVDVNGYRRDYGYDSNGKLIEVKDHSTRVTTADGKHWVSDNGEQFEMQIDVERDGNVRCQTDHAALVSRLDGRTETIAKDKSAIVRAADGTIEQTTDATGKTRRFQYGTDGKLNGVTEADGTQWSTADGETWTTPDGRIWKGTVAVEGDGTYRYVDDDVKETVNNLDGTVTVREPNGRITDTLPDGTTRVVQKPVDRAKLSRLAAELHGDDRDHVLGSHPLMQGELSLTRRRKTLAENGTVSERVMDLNEAEREALKGIYHKRYGRTLESDYSFLEGKDKDEFNHLFEKTGDPVQAKADRLITAIDNSYHDYSWYSFSHTDRKNNSNEEVRDTLKSMNSDEMKQMDNYYKRVYGTSLHEAIRKDTPPATREMCEIYLKGNDRLTAEDRQKLQKLESEEKIKVEGTPDPELSAAELDKVFDNNFEKLDRNQDGFVSQREIDHAMKDPDYKGKDAQLLVVLKDKREDIEELSDDERFDEDDGVTRNDMKKLAELAIKVDKSKDEQKLIDAVETRLNHSGAVLQDCNAKAGKNLWGQNIDPIDSICPESVEQNYIGDCYFLAPVAAMANTPDGKKDIKNMIEDNGDGTYTVTFPGDPKHPITVDEPTQAELGRGATPGQDGIWVAVLEKAYGKYKDKHSDADYEYSTDSIEGGSCKDTLELLTGKDVDRDYLSDTSASTTHEKLTAAVRDKRPVVARPGKEFGQEFGLADGLTDGAGVPMKHVYTVTAYDPETRMVTLRNPWGQGEPEFRARKLNDPNDGTFTMSLEEFHKEFERGSVDYAQAA